MPFLIITIMAGFGFPSSLSELWSTSLSESLWAFLDGGENPLGARRRQHSLGRKEGRDRRLEEKGYKGPVL
jgi:hypothetical protein